MEEFETFDFLINEEDEVMLLLYQREGEPAESRIELDEEAKTAILYRNPNDTVVLNDISEDVFDSLKDEEKLMVCELSRTKSDDEAEIVYAYEAEIEF